MSYTVKGVTQLHRRLDAIGKSASRDTLERIQTKAIENAKKKVPRKTGNLGRTIRRGTRTSSYAIVRAMAGYAAYVELGTRPHVIRPRKGGYLRFPAQGTPTTLAGRPRTAAVRAGGAFAFARKVNHPGTKAQPYLVPGAKDAIASELGREPIIRAWNGAA